MSSTFYMKLYYEIIDDPKMGRMSDNNWRKCLEFFLLAGEFDHNGYLPEVKDIAWRLRISIDKIQKNIDYLCQPEIKIITKTDDGYFITNYIKRQGRISDAKRMDAYRDRKRISDTNATEVQQTSYDDVTSRNTDIDIDIDIDTNKDKDTAAAGKTNSVFSVYEQNIGMLNPMISEELIKAETEFGPAWIVDAILEAVKANVRRWKYIRAILDNWKANGRGDIRNKPIVDDHASRIVTTGRP